MEIMPGGKKGPGVGDTPRECCIFRTASTGLHIPHHLPLTFSFSKRLCIDDDREEEKSEHTPGEWPSSDPSGQAVSRDVSYPGSSE